MSLLRPYQTLTPNSAWISKQLGIDEENKKINNLHMAAANPDLYIETRANNMEDIAKKLAKTYGVISGQLDDYGFSDDKKNQLLSEIIKSQYSVEKAILDSAYGESDMLLFKGLKSNKVPKQKYYTREKLEKYAALSEKQQRAIAEAVEKKKSSSGSE